MLSLKLISASYRLSGRLDPEKLDHIIETMNIKRSTILDYVYPNNVKVAAIQMKAAPCKDLKTFVQECCRLIDTAVKAGAHVVLFPHLFGLTPLSIDKTSAAITNKFIEDLRTNRLSGNALRTQFNQISERFTDFLFDCYYHLFFKLAHRYNIYIAAGSTYVTTAKGIYCRSYLFSPDHQEAFFQDKIQLSPSERKLGVLAGDELNVLDLKIGRVALLAAEDAAFFECYKVARTMGTQIVLSPTLHSDRTSHSLRYNASLLAAQHFNLFTACSSLFSTGDETPAFGGASGIYAPQMMTRNLDGVVVHTNESMAQSHVLCARVDPPKLVENMDVYAYSTNSGFCETMLNEVYPDFFKTKELESRDQEKKSEPVKKTERAAAQ